jgi:hypothetical protein
MSEENVAHSDHLQTSHAEELDTLTYNDKKNYNMWSCGKAGISTHHILHDLIKDGQMERVLPKFVVMFHMLTL